MGALQPKTGKRRFGKHRGGLAGIGAGSGMEPGQLGGVRSALGGHDVCVGRKWLASLSREELGEAFLDLAARSTFRWAHRHPALQDRDFLVVITLFAVDDRRLLGVPGGRFASVAIAFGRVDGAVAQL